MYTTSDLCDIVSLYYTQAFKAYYFPARSNNKLLSARLYMQLSAHRCLLYTIAANMIYEGRY